MKQQQTPLFDQLLLHAGSNPLSYHVPGHKNGAVFPDEAKHYFENILKLDVTELTGLDDLHSAEGVILESETLLADLYGAKRSFFLVNGSTVGNLAMILSSLNEGDQVLVQRNSHKSIMNGIRLAKADPVFLNPEYHLDWAVAGGVSLEVVKEATKQFPAAKVLILTYPNYYGLAYEIKEIIKFAHEQNIAVLVDEAHGVHFAVNPLFPESAIALGADIVVQSAHKTLPAMTMGAYLHFNSNLQSVDKLTSYLQMLQSSSPSYPLMASLDLARSYLGTYSKEDISYLIQSVEGFKNQLDSLSDIKVLTSERYKVDPLKVTIQSTKGLSGYEVQQLLEREGVYTELADPINVLLILPLLKKDMFFPFDDTIGKIHKALKNTCKTKAQAEPIKSSEPFSALSVSYKEMEQLTNLVIPLEESAGKICAEMIIPYPPGIPLILPGEKITKKAIEELIRLLKNKAKIQGGEYLAKARIKVFHR